jgi:hypothetical protein
MNGSAYGFGGDASVTIDELARYESHRFAGETERILIAAMIAGHGEVYLPHPFIEGRQYRYDVAAARASLHTAFASDDDFDNHPVRDGRNEGEPTTAPLSPCPVAHGDQRLDKGRHFFTVDDTFDIDGEHLDMEDIGDA